MAKARHYSEGTPDDDVLKTSDVNWDAIYGGGGNDTIFGSLGYDFVDGGQGHDVFFASVDGDSLHVVDFGSFLHVTLHEDGVPGPVATAELRGIEEIVTLTGGISPADYVDGSQFLFPVGF